MTGLFISLNQLHFDKSGHSFIHLLVQLSSIDGGQNPLTFSRFVVKLGSTFACRLVAMHELVLLKVTLMGERTNKKKGRILKIKAEEVQKKSYEGRLYPDIVPSFHIR